MTNKSPTRSWVTTANLAGIYKSIRLRMEPSNVLTISIYKGRSYYLDEKKIYITIIYISWILFQVLYIKKHRLLRQLYSVKHDYIWFRMKASNSSLALCLLATASCSASANPEYDYVVIGSGAGGGPLA